MRLFRLSLVFIVLSAIKVNSDATDYSTINRDGSYSFGLTNQDVGGHYHKASATPNNVVSGRFGSRNPATKRIEETVYTAGPRGFRARGPNIHRKQDLSQVPRGPIGTRDDPLADPYEDPSYSFGFSTPGHTRKENADSTGRVRGGYSYVDDVGERHAVQYNAGAGTGFQVTNAVPDSPNSVRYSAPLYKSHSKARGKIAFKSGPSGQYKFVSSAPDQRRSETTGPDGITRGSYSYLDDKGVQRTVQYIAGAGIGYRVVKTTVGPGTHLIPTPALPEYELTPVVTNNINSNNNYGGAGADDNVGSTTGTGGINQSIGSGSGSSTGYGTGTGSGSSSGFGTGSGSSSGYGGSSGSNSNSGFGGSSGSNSNSGYGGSSGSNSNSGSGSNSGLGSGNRPSNLPRPIPIPAPETNDNDDAPEYYKPKPNPSGSQKPSYSSGNSGNSGNDRPDDQESRPTGPSAPFFPTAPSSGGPPYIPSGPSGPPGPGASAPSAGGSTDYPGAGDYDDLSSINLGLVPPKPIYPRPFKPTPTAPDSPPSFLPEPTDHPGYPKEKPTRPNRFDEHSSTDKYYPPSFSYDVKPLDKDREEDWHKYRKDSTFVRNVGEWYVGIPPGASIRAHIQNIDILPYGNRAPPPGEALQRDAQKAL